MRNCDRCLENGWTHEFIDGWIRSTCKFCGYEVEFESRKTKKLKQGNYAKTHLPSLFTGNSLGSKEENKDKRKEA